MSLRTASTKFGLPLTSLLRIATMSGQSVQEKVVHDVRSLVTTIEEMGNPFMEQSMDLLNLNSKAVMP